jgi:hypothetical protein
MAQFQGFSLIESTALRLPKQCFALRDLVGNLSIVREAIRVRDKPTAFERPCVGMVLDDTSTADRQSAAAATAGRGAIDQ